MLNTQQPTGNKAFKSRLKLLGLILRLHREDRGYQQHELADMAGIHRGVLSKLERGDLEDVKLFGHLERIAQVYGVKVEQLFEYGDLKVFQ